MATTQPSGISTTTLVLATVGTLTALTLSYALYFDHRRRTDPTFRRSLARRAKDAQRASATAAASAVKERAARIRAAVDAANAEGFPSDPEKTEAFFMAEIEKGETLVAQPGADEVEAALCFYRALKVYPQPRELIGIYDKTVSKPIIDILAEMVAIDSSIPVGSSGGGSDADEVPVE